ncbi:MAG TPA: sulfite exporter TauE/SafE family protein, partial [Gammaproteobacteria bacterium]|nr:sulfite exporter TauE/SafE family protein [Gammaproteobacteria bacterium]
TSNFMLGMTATASAGIYFAAGYIHPSIAFPVLLGVLCGAWSGVRLFEKAKPHTLRTIFSIIVFILGLQMIYNGAVHLK